MCSLYPLARVTVLVPRVPVSYTKWYVTLLTMQGGQSFGFQLFATDLAPSIGNRELEGVGTMLCNVTIAGHIEGVGQIFAFEATSTRGGAGGV